MILFILSNGFGGFLTQAKSEESADDSRFIRCERREKKGKGKEEEEENKKQKKQKNISLNE